MLVEKDYTGQHMEEKKIPNPVSEAAAAMGRLGGPARAKKLSSKRRKEIAQEGAEARWGKKRGESKAKKVAK